MERVSMKLPNPDDGIAEVFEYIRLAAHIWIAKYEDEQPTGTLSNRFLAEAEGAYMAAREELNSPGYRCESADWE